MKTLELAKLLGGILHGEEAREVRKVAALATAGPDELTYAEGAKFLDLAVGSQAGCILVPEGCLLTGRTTMGSRTLNWLSFAPPRSFVPPARSSRESIPRLLSLRTPAWPRT